jgi:hypothetical protein
MYTEDHELRNTYIWKTCTVAGGIYLFFLIERLLKVLFRIKQVNTVLQNNCKSIFLSEKISKFPLQQYRSSIYRYSLIHGLLYTSVQVPKYNQKNKLK